MIAALTGRLLTKSPTQVTLDVQGVGYEIHIPLSTFYGLPDVSAVTSLRVHTHLREDAIQLFGFLTLEEKGAFLLLTGITGIGPKLALSALSALSVPALVSAVRNGDVDKLATVPGIGKKFAGRIALELKDKVDRLHPALVKQADHSSATPTAVLDDAQSALVNLGYRSSEVSQILKRLSRCSREPYALADLIRTALKELGRGAS